MFVVAELLISDLSWRYSIFQSTGGDGQPWPGVHDDSVWPWEPGLSDWQRLSQDSGLPGPLWWRPDLHLPLHHQLRELHLPRDDGLQHQQGGLHQSERWGRLGVLTSRGVIRSDLTEPEVETGCDLKDKFAVSELTEQQLLGTWYIVRSARQYILYPLIIFLYFLLGSGSDIPIIIWWLTPLSPEGQCIEYHF